VDLANDPAAPGRFATSTTLIFRLAKALVAADAVLTRSEQGLFGSGKKRHVPAIATWAANAGFVQKIGAGGLISEPCSGGVLFRLGRGAGWDGCLPPRPLAGPLQARLGAV
jgi:hypothetical protein